MVCTAITRVLTACLAIAELGLVIYVGKTTSTLDSNPRIQLLLATAVISIVVLIYVGIGSRFRSRLISLALLFCVMVLWLAGSIALVVQATHNTHNGSSSAGSGSDATATPSPTSTPGDNPWFNFPASQDERKMQWGGGDVVAAAEGAKDYILEKTKRDGDDRERDQEEISDNTKRKRNREEQQQQQQEWQDDDILEGAVEKEAVKFGVEKTKSKRSWWSPDPGDPWENWPFGPSGTPTPTPTPTSGPGSGGGSGGSGGSGGGDSDGDGSGSDFGDAEGALRLDDGLEKRPRMALMAVIVLGFLLWAFFGLLMGIEAMEGLFGKSRSSRSSSPAAD